MHFFTFLAISLNVCVHALTQLSFSGGGAFGAVEIGILKHILVSEPAKQYDLYTGVSAGALNAGFLSYYHDVKSGVDAGEAIYSSLSNKQVYELLPSTGISVYNTAPLRKTLTRTLDSMRAPPVVPALIGTVNLYTGYLDIFQYLDVAPADRVSLLMCSSAIPALFPPIALGAGLYVDGGTLSNELLQVEHDGKWLNITYITPSQSLDLPVNVSLTSLEEIMKRELSIVWNGFNDPFKTLNTQCATPIGEVHLYYVDGALLSGYSMLDFDSGAELVAIGFANAQHRVYPLC